MTEEVMDQETEFMKEMKTFLGIEFQNKRKAKTIQSLWLFALPPLIGIAVLTGSAIPMWLSRPVLMIQMIDMFFDGKEICPWAKKWLISLGIYYFIICGGGWVMSDLHWWKYIPLIPSVIAMLAAIPCLFPLCVTKQIIGFPAVAAPLPPSVFLVWFSLFTAYFCGGAARKIKSGI